MQFRLLAVRPIEDPKSKYSKTLKLNTFYSFYSAFNYEEYIDDSNEVIKYDETKEIDLYSFDNTNVNVSAIVGKNGTGKSTLVELFYGLIFLLSKQVGLIDEKTVKESHKFTDDEMIQYQNDVIELNKLKLQVYYQLGSSIFRLTKKRNVEIHKFDLQADGNYKLSKRVKASKDFVKKHFFYSVATNYSLYALNTNECGLWLKPLFHKNDAYQTPLVLNPMRTQGDIDINRVTYLSKNRLLANLLSPIPSQIKKEDSLRSLVNGKVAD
ncbi:ATP-binding cassette domain-containing protein [Flavobacterium qiangtangense]|uniref:ATP-binding cassette domain-containing protein n=1 Tax=Flavobacterium qiangtangense TaxID=1442595 RepID=A0ABW1PJU4_9FLAO